MSDFWLTGVRSCPHTSSKQCEDPNALSFKGRAGKKCFEKAALYRVLVGMYNAMTINLKGKSNGEEEEATVYKIKEAIQLVLKMLTRPQMGAGHSP